jgi:hypothetical protein
LTWDTFCFDLLILRNNRCEPKERSDELNVMPSFGSKRLKKWVYHHRVRACDQKSFCASPCVGFSFINACFDFMLNVA